MGDTYGAFLESKHIASHGLGFRPMLEVNQALFPFQRFAVEQALERGRAALFEECGTGKTAQQLEWARHVAHFTARPVLILAPLAVSRQTVREGEKFGIAVNVCREPGDVQPGINVTNYERVERFNPAMFGGVVLDESSILKSYMGRTKRYLLEAFEQTRFRLCCTATPAPNDHLELGNHAEFLGVMSSHEMIARWFLPDTSTFGTYTLKGHAVRPFWDWVSSWALCIGRPSDVGFEDEGFELPKLEIVHHAVDVDVVDGRRDGQLFRVPEMSATAVHTEKRRTAADRAACAAELVRADPAEPWLIWVETDYDAEAVRAALPEVVEVHGRQNEATKEERLIGFCDGTVRYLLTKPSLAGFGLNWQHCSRVVFVGPGFSYEQFYQAVRRTWRFGQRRPVQVHVILASTESHVWDVVRRKADDHERMKGEMHAAMRRAQARGEKRRADYAPTHKATIPAWLKTA